MKEIVGKENKQVALIWEGSAKPDDPVFKEGWTITLSPGGRSPIPLNETPDKADVGADASDIAARDEAQP